MLGHEPGSPAPGRPIELEKQLEARTRELAGFVLPKITTQVVSHRDYSRRFAFTATLLVGSAKNRTTQASSKASLRSFLRLHGGAECGRSFRNRRKILRQLRANLIRPDNLSIHHEVLHQPLLRREGLLEVLARAFVPRDPDVFLLTREPVDPVDRLVVRGSARGRSSCGLLR